jgi:predicted small lipoprotein YifL
MKIRILSLLLVGSLFLTSACGQKGPLYREKAAKPVAEEKAEKNEIEQTSEEKSEKN